MNTREKIIVAIAGLVAVYGVGSLFGGGSPSPKEPTAGQDKALHAQVDTLIKNIDAAVPTSLDAAMLTAMATPWRVEAVYERPMETKVAATAKPVGLPKYTGYVELGTGRLAVVDGYEYQAGDTLEGGGYKIVAIVPDKVILERLEGGNRVELPYEGQEAQ